MEQLVQDSTAQIVSELNQVRNKAGLPPLATPAQAEFDAMKKELDATKKELERAKESFKTAVFTLKEDYDRLEEEKYRLEEQITELQDQIRELTTKEEEEPTPAVPAPAVPAPNRPAKLQHWYFCQFLLELDPSKKYYNTFRIKWVNVMATARGVGGQFQKRVEEINNKAIRNLQEMINELETLHNSFQFPVVYNAILYLKKVQAELATQNA